MKRKLYIKNDKGRYEEYVEPKKTDNNVYRKVGNKYVPIGIMLNSDWLQDGLWLVRHEGSTGMSPEHNASHWGLTKLADVPVTDVTKIAMAEDIYDAVDKYLFGKFGYCVGNIPHQDISDEIVKVIMGINEKK